MKIYVWLLAPSCPPNYRRPWSSKYFCIDRNWNQRMDLIWENEGEGCAKVNRMAKRKRGKEIEEKRAVSNELPLGLWWWRDIHLQPRAMPRSQPVLALLGLHIPFPWHTESILPHPYSTTRVHFPPLTIACPRRHCRSRFTNLLRLEAPGDIRLSNLPFRNSSS